MLRIQSSPVTDSAREFEERRPEPGETNVAWLARHLGSEAPTDQETLLLLVGARGTVPFRVRVAQGHLRHDLTPSHWSHVALVRNLPGDAGRWGDCRLVEVPLEPEVHGLVQPSADEAPPVGDGSSGPGDRPRRKLPEDWNPTSRNGLREPRLRVYDDPERYPNLAVLRLPVRLADWAAETTPERLSILERYTKQRNDLDAAELILRWLAFTWGVGHTSNPLLEGQGLPSAAMVELVLAAVGYDVTPNLDSRASCPEAIWQTAKWWYPYYNSTDRPRYIRGFWKCEDRILP